ncbi:hypothetical protein SDRG_14747 [Saprolegnia diclina VS20]|uniref:Uncharacterized protein n=1 Tax=Saprolegnia diclina (strain VS20) TaxID=1156394 RepID=T0PYW1_SAPDV|nr:hypothetical protein SDRG_14747 [Saprolegnia diclina VS20]EQC27421.1 hypothetical protein SDRG_14747 [Saprolegnia diclina VS20]|eukprot:XP_008619121.1 hypothetical protein SDRG_14747 [Saprolegnia diclina VS20]
MDQGFKAALIGAVLAFKGCALAAGLPELRGSYRRTLWVLAGTSALLILIGATIAWPIQLVLWLFLGRNSPYTTLLASVFQKWVTGVPFVLIAACRYVHPTLVDNLFFLGLGQEHASFVPVLSSIPISLFDWDYLRATATFLAYRSALFLILALGSFLTPLFGSLFAIAAFGFKIRRTEMVLSSVVFGLYVVPWTRPIAIELAKIWFDARAVTKELFYPVFARKAKLVTEHEIPCTISPHQSAMLFGFSYVLGYFVQVPVVGPFVWLLAFIAAGMAAPRMFHLTPAKL